MSVIETQEKLTAQLEIVGWTKAGRPARVTATGFNRSGVRLTLDAAVPDGAQGRLSIKSPYGRQICAGGTLIVVRSDSDHQNEVVFLFDDDQPYLDNGTAGAFS